MANTRTLHFYFMSEAGGLHQASAEAIETERTYKVQRSGEHFPFTSKGRVDKADIGKTTNAYPFLVVLEKEDTPEAIRVLLEHVNGELSIVNTRVSVLTRYRNALDDLAESLRAS